jgi:hypothetical protein
LASVIAVSPLHSPSPHRPQLHLALLHFLNACELAFLPRISGIQQIAEFFRRIFAEAKACNSAATLVRDTEGDV